VEIADFDKRFPASPLIAEPARGISGISQRYRVISWSLLPFHHVCVINAQSAPVAIKDNGYSEPHCRFSSSHDHDKKHKYLTLNLVQKSRKRHKTQVRTVEHKLDAKERGDYILLYDEPYGSYKKEEHAQDEVMQ